MKRFSLFILCICLFLCQKVYAIECCALQGGSTGTFTEDGFLICRDETISYEAACKRADSSGNGTTIQKKGCTNKSAKNYDPAAKIDNGSCIFYLYGCTDQNAFNYNAAAERDDGSCTPKKEGCMNSNAVNYLPEANTDNGTCLYESILEKEEILPFAIRYQKNKNLLEGEEKVITEGKNGLKKVKYKVQISENGKESKKQRLGEEIVLKPHIEVIQMGTKNPMQDFTILLYTLSSFFFVICFFYHYNIKTNMPPFLHLLTQMNQTTLLEKIQKVLLYICYILFCLSFLDLFSLIIRKLRTI